MPSPRPFEGCPIVIIWQRKWRQIVSGVVMRSFIGESAFSRDYAPAIRNHVQRIVHFVTIFLVWLRKRVFHQTFVSDFTLPYIYDHSVARLLYNDMRFFKLYLSNRACNILKEWYKCGRETSVTPLDYEF